MNFKSSIFTIISAISCTSFIGDAMAASCKYAGWYRWRENGVSKDWCMPCPAGCYCPKAADNMDRAPNQWMSCTSSLRKYGIYKCTDGYTSVGSTGINPKIDKTYYQGAMSEDECFFKAKDTGNKVKYARAETCPAGQYLKAGYEKCQPCKTGYICPGVPMSSNSFKVKANTTWDSSWKKATYKLWPNPNHDDGIYLCPSGKVANSNHTDCQSGNTYCKAGQYLPKNATTCSSCKDRYYCPGGSFPNASYDQGLKTCPSGQKPDALQKSCIKDTSASSSSSNGSIKCYAGQYLPANATSCSPCKDRYYCLGGTFSKASIDQGIREIGGVSTTNSNSGGSTSTSTQRVYCNPGRYLPAGGKETADCRQCKERYYCIGGTFPVASYDQGLRSCPPNSAPVLPDRTKCEYGSFECEPGYYMRAKGTGCTKCPTTKNYCPGGTYKPNDVDQGIKVCPDLTVANDKRSACKMTITKQQLQYGLAKKTDAAVEEQCWTRATMPEYVYCMFGGKVNIKLKEESSTNSTDSGTDTGTDTGDSAKTE